MTETGCPFCPLVQALETAETYRGPSGNVSRRVALLPTAVAVLGADQFYPGYTVVIARRHATELYHLPEAESTAYFQDMLRVELTPNGQFNVTEFGTVKDPDQFKALMAYSPYHHVKDGTRYPAVLLTSGANDPRVDPYHARKMTARLQAATGSGLEVLLRASGDTGHSASPRMYSSLRTLFPVSSMPVRSSRFIRICGKPRSAERRFSGSSGVAEAGLATRRPNSASVSASARPKRMLARRMIKRR